jgi:hypothetical protein
LAGKILAHTKGLAPDSLSKLATYAESALSSLSLQPQSANGSFTNAFHQAVALGYAISNLYRVIGNDAKADAALKEALKLESTEINALAGAEALPGQTPNQMLLGSRVNEGSRPSDQSIGGVTPSQPNSPASAGYEMALARGESMTEAVLKGISWLKAERWILPAIGVMLVSLSALGIVSLPILGLVPIAYDIFFHKLPAAIAAARKPGGSVFDIFSLHRLNQSLIFGLYGLPGLLSGYAFHLPPELAVAAILLSAIFGLVVEEFHTIHDRYQFRASLRNRLSEIAHEMQSQVGRPVVHDSAVLSSSISGMIPQGKDSREALDGAMKEVDRIRTALEAAKGYINQSA